MMNPIQIYRINLRKKIDTVKQEIRDATEQRRMLNKLMQISITNDTIIAAVPARQ